MRGENELREKLIHLFIDILAELLPPEQKASVMLNLDHYMPMQALEEELEV